MRVRFVPLSLLALGAAATVASAGTSWKERMTSVPGVDRNHSNQSTVSFGDAGEFLSDANITMGDQPLLTITGSLVAAQRPQATGGTLRSLDADLYCISITDAANFSAITSTGDFVLALFDANGVGVAFNDNRTDSLTSTASRLVSVGTDAAGNPVGIPGLTNGTYYLGISRVDGGATARRFSRPLNAAGSLIFPGMTNGGDEATDPLFPTRRQDLGPITPATALAGWELFATTAAPFNSNYTITLTGAGYHTVPTPAASALIGLAGIGALRRRRR